MHVCMCVCVWVHAYMHVCVPVWSLVCSCMRTHTTLGVFCHCFPPYFLRWGPSLNLESDLLAIVAGQRVVYVCAALYRCVQCVQRPKKKSRHYTPPLFTFYSLRQSGTGLRALARLEGEQALVVFVSMTLPYCCHSRQKCGHAHLFIWLLMFRIQVFMVMHLAFLPPEKLL